MSNKREFPRLMGAAVVVTDTPRPLCKAASTSR